MTDINHVVLIGNLTRNVTDNERDFGFAANGQARANVSIAVNRSKKVGDEWQDETSFFDVTIWGKTAENLKPYLTKGQRIAVDGYLKQDRWEKDGQKFSRITIVANSVQLCGNRNSGNNESAINNQNINQTNTQPVYSGPTANGNVDTDAFPEDIPF